MIHTGREWIDDHYRSYGPRRKGYVRAAILFSFAVLVSSFGVYPAGAQFAGKETYSRRELLSDSTVTADSARNSCIMFGSARWSPDVLQAGKCRARGCTVAGTTTKIRWAACEYEHDWISRPSGSEPADTLREIEVVLYRTPGRQPGLERDSLAGQRFTAVWQEVYEPEFFRSVNASVTAMEGGGLLLAIQECVNGTGGCEQSFLLDRGTTWRPVKLTFLDSVEHRYPGAVQRAFHVDPRTLRAEVWLYSKTDANCCPSRSVLVSLRLRGDALEAKTIRLEVR